MTAQPVEGSRRSVQVTIVSYRTAKFVERSLHALEAERKALDPMGIDLTCYIIDNSQVDYEPLLEAVTDNGWGDWVTVVCAERNGGFAYGNNRGFEFGLAQSPVPDYFYLLNPDAEIRPGAVAELVAFMDAHPRAGTAASGIEDHDGVLWPVAFQFPNAVDEFAKGARLGFVSKLLEPFLVSRAMSDEPAEVDWFPGAAMICRTAVVEELGGMDEAYFLYFEETDFCHKLQHHGWTNWYVPASRVIHATGQSTGVTAAGQELRRLPPYWFESRRRYFLKNHGPLYAALSDVACVVGHSLGRAQLTLRGRGDRMRDRFISDLIRQSSLVPGARAISAPRETLSPKPD